MTAPTACDFSTPSGKALSQFLSTYGAWLMGVGATCIRLEKNVKRIARAYNKEAEIFIMPHHIHISVWDEGSSDATTSLATVRHTPISFNINNALSELSWEIADNKIDFDTAVHKFRHIINNDRQNKWIVLFLVTLANASFCRLFGGDMVAMAIVGIATMSGYYLKQLLLERNVDIRAVAVICSFVSSVLGATDALFAIGDTPMIAVGTSVLYLVPGIPFLNSFSDLLYRHYLCAFGRFADAVVLTCCLSFGLCAGMLLMHIGMF